MHSNNTDSLSVGRAGGKKARLSIMRGGFLWFKGGAGVLTPKQERFVEEYLVDLNGTQAAIRAGYSEKTANEQAAQLLAKLSIQEAIQAAVKARSERTQITADSVLTEIAKLGFSNMLDYVTIQKDGTAYVDLSALTREQAAAIQEMTVDEYMEGSGEDARSVKRVKIKLSDKKSALELLGKHLKLFTDKVEHSGSVAVRFGGEEKLQDEND